MSDELFNLPQVKQFWEAYIASLPPASRPNDVKVDAAFAGNEETTDELIQLYLDGKKTAGSSLVKDFESAGDPLPQVGNYWIALDSSRNPKCILKTVRSAIHRFGDIPLEVVRAEGEGDLSVDYWKRAHGEFYSPFLAKWGISNLDDAEVITEFFEMVFLKPKLQNAASTFVAQASINWQPYLVGSSIRLRPLVESDFDALFSAASDPLIWEQHPDNKRYTRERFEVYFRSGLESKGALAVIDIQSGRLIGSSRYTSYNPRTSSVEIGFTFLTRDYWGGVHNWELKTLMLNYAFQHVDTAYFVVGKDNLRSRKAMTKIGGILVFDLSATPVVERKDTSVVFQINKENWIKNNTTPKFTQPSLSTSRITLEPVVENHVQELLDFFSDLKLHEYVPYEPLSFEKQQERCAKWAKRRSPDGTELWLNWAGRNCATGSVLAHFQAGLKQDGTASVGYVVARAFQGQGIATEAMEAIFAYLRDHLGVKEIKAWTDTRNIASHRLAKKLGMVQVELIKNADFFKGSNSDEFVFSKVFHG